MTDAPVRFRYGIDFAIDGDIRFISHNDSLRMFSRAAARAALPVCFSQGFNPRSRISLPFPRPVGQASDVERLLIDLTESVDLKSLVHRLGRQMSAGITLRSAIALDPSDPCQPRSVRYLIDIAPAQRDAVASAAQILLGSESTSITRVRHKDGRSKVVDIRPFIDAIEFTDDGLAVSVFVSETGTATPAEVCSCLDLELDAVNHLTRRVNIQWNEKQNKP